MDSDSEHGWRELAACRSHDPAVFFAGGEAGPSGHALQTALSICAGCPVQEGCLDYAVAANPRYGVWGGHTQAEIRVIRRRRRLRPAS
ncbi:MAG: WhiB family transcriptional regulator [Acidimicrobiia bacterium]